MSTFIKGDAVILSIWDGSAYEPIGCLTSNSLSVTRNVIEAQTKCAPGEITRVAGSTSSEVSFEATYIRTNGSKTNFDSLLGFINDVSGSTQYWKMSTDQVDPVAYYGNAVLADLEITAAAGDEFATFSGTLQNTGLVLTVDPNA
jgi:hypothetical protein